MEEWKLISGYLRYEVSNLGRLRSTKNNKIKILSTYRKKDVDMVGITVDYNSKTYSVRKLVAEAFVPNPNNFSRTRKINKSLGNIPSNIEWIEKREYIPRERKKSKKQIEFENKELISEGFNYKGAWINSKERLAFNEL